MQAPCQPVTLRWFWAMSLDVQARGLPFAFAWQVSRFPTPTHDCTAPTHARQVVSQHSWLTICFVSVDPAVLQYLFQTILRLRLPLPCMRQRHNRDVGYILHPILAGCLCIHPQTPSAGHNVWQTQAFLLRLIALKRCRRGEDGEGESDALAPAVWDWSWLGVHTVLHSGANRCQADSGLLTSQAMAGVQERFDTVLSSRALIWEANG